jgi:hypothetical protein
MEIYKKQQLALCIDRLITITTFFFIKSHLTSLCQREGEPLFGKEGQGEIFS